MLMCQVLDGEPPIQIKWFKDNLDLAALLMQQQANEDNHQQQQQPSDYGPAASKLISLALSGLDAANSSSAAGQQQQQQQHLLDHIEMISNDELGSSLLFRKVKQQHGGNYTCLASNRFGATSYTSLMTVKGETLEGLGVHDEQDPYGARVTIVVTLFNSQSFWYPSQWLLDNSKISAVISCYYFCDLGRYGRLLC